MRRITNVEDYYASDVDSIMHVMVCCRPGLSHTTNMISKFMTIPG